MNSNGMRPVHPGEILQEEFLEPLGISESAFAHSLNEPLNVVNDIVMQQRCVSADLAKKLSEHHARVLAEPASDLRFAGSWNRTW